MVFVFFTIRVRGGFVCPDSSFGSALVLGLSARAVVSLSYPLVGRSARAVVLCVLVFSGLESLFQHFFGPHAKPSQSGYNRYVHNNGLPNT